MIKIFRAPALGGALLLATTGFAIPALAQDTATPEQSTPAPEAPAATTGAPTATAPLSTAVPGELGKPAPGKGQVVFFRESKLMGAALSFKVRENDVELGKLSNGVYFVLDVDPGVHEFVVQSEAKDITPVEVEEGEVYFLRFGISVGIVAGRPNLSPSTQQAFDEAAGKMKPSTWRPEAAK